MSKKFEEEEIEDVLVLDDEEESRGLVIFNDEVNTFEYVIKMLIEICSHGPMQAEQCTSIIHFKGKCEVKKGVYSVLKPMRERMVEADINAVIV